MKHYDPKLWGAAPAIPPIDVTSAKPDPAYKRDKRYGMTAMSRRLHKAADHPGLGTRAYQYACAMRGIEYEHSSNLVHSSPHVICRDVQEPGKKRRTKRACEVQIGRGHGWFTIPNWDYIERGAL